MNLIDFESEFFPRVLTRAIRLYEGKKVIDISQYRPGIWRARVKGNSEVYQVGLVLYDDGEIEGAVCSCPYDWGGPCKHIGAFIYALRDYIKENDKEFLDSLKELYSGEFSEEEEAFKRSDHKSGIDTVGDKLGEELLNREVLSMQVESEFPPVEELLSKYEKLDEINKKIMALMAVAWEPLTMTTIMNIYNKSRLLYIDRNITPADLRVKLKYLYKEKLIANFYGRKNHYKFFQCSYDLSNMLCKLYFNKDEAYRKVANNIRKVLNRNYLWDRDEMVRRAVCYMRISAFLGNGESFDKEIYELCDAWDESDEVFEQVLYLWMGTGMDFREIDYLPLEIQGHILAIALEYKLRKLEDVSGISQRIIELFSEFSDNTKEIVLRPLAMSCFFRGNMNPFHTLTKGAQSYLNEIYRAIGLLLKGGREETLRLLEKENNRFKKALNNKKVCLPRLGGVFLVLSYLSAPEKAIRKKVSNHIRQVRQLGDFQFNMLPVFEILDTVNLYLEHKYNEARDMAGKIEPMGGYGDMFYYLSLHWLDMLSGKIDALKDYCEKADQAGYDFIAEQMNSLLQAYDARLPHIGLIENEPLYQLIEHREQWEMVLDSLEELSDTKANASSEPLERLVWLIDFDDWEATPKIQKKGKKGWSKGRVLQLSNWKKLLRDVPYVTEADIQILSNSRKSSYFWRGAIIMGYNDMLWKYFVGHPLLFLSDSPQTSVRIESAKPSFRVKRHKGGFSLELWPPATAFGEHGALIRETQVKYLYVEKDKKLNEMLKVLRSNNFLIPSKAEDRLKKLVSKLEPVLEVRAPFISDDLPRVEPDPKPCVQLIPLNEEYIFEVFVKPFGSAPPYCKPGQGDALQIGFSEGERVATNRDLNKEKQLFDAFIKEIPALVAGEQHAENLWYLPGDVACLQVMLEMKKMLENGDITVEWPKGKKLNIQSYAGFDTLRVRINKKGQWFEVEGEVEVGEGQVVQLQELLKLSQKRSSFVEIGPGKFLALTNELKKNLQSVEAVFDSGKNGKLQLNPLAVPAIEDFTALLADSVFDEAYVEYKRKIHDAFKKKHRLPRNFKAKLRSYQKEGYLWLHRCADWGVGACLADDMGLGKTIQALAFLSSRAKLGPALVIAPASVCRNWYAETEKFAPQLKPILFGEGDRASTIKKAKAKDLIIATYDLMAREGALFSSRSFATIILDEAQAIKNRSTNRSKVAMKLKGDFLMTMTGTPIENHLGELWNQFNFLNPGLLGSLTSFKERFAIPIEKMKDKSRREQLKSLVKPFILRRRKDEVLKDLPQKTEITLRVQLSGEERAFYEALRRNAVEKLSNSTQKKSAAGQRHLQILAEIMRLRRAACHPKLVDINPGIEASSKMELFGEIIHELKESGHKALVFSQFVGHLKLMEDYLKAQKIKYQYLDGSTPLKKRQTRINEFQNGKGEVFLISLKAGGTGLNLTAADYVIHMDPWWNPAVEDQATDRAHRIGQERPVTVYRLVAENTIEEKIIDLHARKRDLADSLLSGTDISAKLNADELLRLLEDGM